MKKTVTITRVVEEKKEVRCSDFSGQPIPELHWSCVTKIWCATSDHGDRTSGNVGTVFTLDLLPEEMDDFKTALSDLILSMKAKYEARNVKPKK